MPSSILNTDIMYPNLTGKSTEESLFVIMNYLALLKEQLTYSLSNLGLANINANSLGELAGVINSPIIVRLEGVDGALAQIDVNLAGINAQIRDAEGNISDLWLTAQSLMSRLTDAEGNISTLYQTAESLTSRVQDAEGNISTLVQTSESLMTRIQDAEGNLSTVQQTVASVTSRVSSVEGNYSQLQQTVNGISATVSSVSGEVTRLEQTVNGLTLSASNGESSSTISLTSGSVTISSARVSFTGMVTFSDLSSNGGTVINGGNISTGIITAIGIESCSIDSSTITGSTFETVLNSSGSVGGELKMYYLYNISDSYLAGGLRLDSEGSGTAEESRYRLFLYTNSVLGVAFALKLESAGGMSLESGAGIYMSASTYITLRAPTITINGQTF